MYKVVIEIYRDHPVCRRPTCERYEKRYLDYDSAVRRATYAGAKCRKRQRRGEIDSFDIQIEDDCVPQIRGASIPPVRG